MLKKAEKGNKMPKFDAYASVLANGPSALHKLVAVQAANTATLRSQEIDECRHCGVTTYLSVVDGHYKSNLKEHVVCAAHEFRSQTEGAAWYDPDVLRIAVTQPNEYQADDTAARVRARMDRFG